MDIIHNQYRQSFAETGKKAFALDNFSMKSSLTFFNEEGSMFGAYKHDTRKYFNKKKKKLQKPDVMWMQLEMNTKQNIKKTQMCKCSILTCKLC
jgi:hypothetical protein